MTGRRSLHFVKYFYEKVFYKLLLLHYHLSGFLWAWRFFRGGLLLSVLPLFVFVCPAWGLPARDVCVHLLRPGDSGQIPAQGQWAVMAICVIQTAVELELCRAKRTAMVKKKQTTQACSFPWLEAISIKCHLSLFPSVVFRHPVERPLTAKFLLHSIINVFVAPAKMWQF